MAYASLIVSSAIEGTNRKANISGGEGGPRTNQELSYQMK